MSLQILFFEQMSLIALMEFLPSNKTPIVLSSIISLWPYNTPKVWFLLSRDVEVKIKSPKPQYSWTVSDLPPIASIIVIVSLKPLVNTANLAFSLMLIHSQIPLAIALMFFRMPQSSIPYMSSIILTLNCFVDNTFFTLTEFS